MKDIILTYIIIFFIIGKTITLFIKIFSDLKYEKMK